MGWFINCSGFYLFQDTFRIKLKRLLDILISLLRLIVLSPLLLIVSILIKLDSHGPVIYSQKRVGQHGCTFLIHKFRSMREDAEKDGPKWAEKGDSRITRIGRFIRKSRIDELPQLWNVLRSEMSLIGPRPGRHEFIDQLEQEIPYYELRHLVKSGITRWAQVMSPYGASVEDACDKLEYDLFYIKNYSLLLDFFILMKALPLILWHRGR